ncbi:MAG: hypothetical protein ACOC4C_00595 [Fibrobacterota bacterium]
MTGVVFSSKNFKLLALSLVLLAVGFIALGQGPVYSFWSWKLAPVVLVFAYCVLLPYAIVTKAKEEKQKEEHGKKKSGV